MFQRDINQALNTRINATCGDSTTIVQETRIK